MYKLTYDAINPSKDNPSLWVLKNLAYHINWWKYKLLLYIWDFIIDVSNNIVIKYFSNNKIYFYYFFYYYKMKTMRYECFSVSFYL
jgi:hypothetical protein